MVNRKYKPHKKAVKTLKKRTGIKSFEELGMYKKRPVKKLSIGTIVGRGAIGFG